MRCGPRGHGGGPCGPSSLPRLPLAPRRDIRILLRMAVSPERSYDAHVPNKTIYVSDGDLPIYQRAQELAGDNLSAAIAAALRQFVELEEGRREGFRRDRGPGRARQGPEGPVHRHPPGRVGRHDVQPRRDLPRLSRTDRQVRPPYRAQRRLHDGRPGGQADRPARRPRPAVGRQLRVHARRVHARGRGDRGGAAGTESRRSTRWSAPRPSSRPSRISTSSDGPIGRICSADPVLPFVAPWFGAPSAGA